MKGIILSSLLLGGAIGSGGTYAVVQQPNLAGIQQERIARDATVGAWLDGIKQLHEDAVASAQVQQEILLVLKSNAASELGQAATLDEHVLQIACLIKGCKPQAMR